MSRFLTAVAASSVVLALFATPIGLRAQTPAQMEYERQAREYRQAEERRQQEAQRLQQLQNENARRQQDETRRSMQQMIPKGDDSQPPRTGSTAPRGGSASAVEICKVKPLRSGERNPLLGKWRPRDTPQGDGLTQLMKSLAAPGCMLYGLGIEFHEREIRTVIAPSPAQYGRTNEDWWVCVPGTDVQVMRFRVEGPNQLFDPDRNCRLIRVGAASTNAAAAAGPAGAGALPTVTSSPGVGAAAAVSLAAGMAAPGDAFAPVAGNSFFVLRSSVDAVMAKAGIQPAPGVSRLKSWALACESGSPACRQGMAALIAESAAVTKTDASGRARMSPLPPGTYYVFGVAPGNAPPLLWNVKVDLKSGENAVTLDQRNATPLD